MPVIRIDFRPSGEMLNFDTHELLYLDEIITAIQDGYTCIAYESGKVIPLEYFLEKQAYYASIKNGTIRFKE